MVTIDKEAFLFNLNVTQEYCEQQLKQNEKDKQLILRSCPVFDSVVQFTSWEEWSTKVGPYNDDIFSELFNAQLAYKQHAVDELKESIAYKGKILVIEYGSNIPDGVVEIETGGFFDAFDLPPVDTWLYNGFDDFKNGVLFAWIPEQFVKVTDEAISMQFLDILHWFKNPREWLS